VRRTLAALALALLPSAADACATCVSSAYGDRTYSWPYLLLILLPFAVAAVIGGILARVNGVGTATVRRWLARLVHPMVRHKETT
jgi:hypothetical protein